MVFSPFLKTEEVAMMPHVLLASPQMQELGAAICKQRPTQIELGSISWKRFPDKFPNIFIEQMDGLTDRHVAFLACFDTPDTIFEQWSAMRSLAVFKPKSFRILLPYFPTGTMERKDHEGQVATGGTLAKLLSSLPPAGPGPIPLYTWDIHALPIRDFFGDNIAPKFKTGTRMLKIAYEGRDISIAFPDHGSYKRFKTFFSDPVTKEPLYPFIICEKERGPGDKRTVKIVEGEVKGRHIVQVDDLIHSGSTAIEAGNAMLDAGAARVDFYATHGVCEDNAWKKFQGSRFGKVIITDSCPATAAAVRNEKPFEVFSLDESASNAVVAGIEEK